MGGGIEKCHVLIEWPHNNTDKKIIFQMRRGVLKDIMEQPVTISEKDPFTMEQKWFCLLKQKNEVWNK